MKQTIEELKRLQAQPLHRKILMTRQRIREWVEHYGEDGVYVSFSGGKDSTVLLDIVRQDYPNIPAMFVDVPTQYPELRDFAKTWDNVTIIKPKISFLEVCEKYGFPLISKEVSECVWGARKYLTSILENEMPLTDRQTDRQTDRPYRYWFERVTGTGKYKKKISCSEVTLSGDTILNRFGAENTIYTNTKQCESSELCRADKLALQEMTNGGGDNKYRKLRGIGEYSKPQNEAQRRWQQSAFGDNARDANERQGSADKGEYP